ncbi:MAG TPA: response regulator [Opitutaceae bacterium]|jgi:two-component system nitrate/nitrite response regulator NarL
MPRPANALIVDDEAHVRMLIKMLLRQLGIETVWEAGDGSDALEKAAAHKPNVILLDINLPMVGGLEVLRQLKAAHPAIPVVIISSQSTMKTVIQARELGAEAYVLKHAPKSEVLQMLSEAFDNIAAASAASAPSAAPAVSAAPAGDAPAGEPPAPKTA